MLAAIAASGIFAVTVAHAADVMNDNNVGAMQGATQLADNGSGNNGMMNNTPSSMSGNGSMGGATSGNMSGTSGNNMSGTSSNNMSGTSAPMSGSASPSDEGGADTATGDDY